MEHRFPEKGAINAHPIETACQFIVQPCFHRMSEAEPVEIDVALDDLFADPSLCAFATRSYDLLERRVQPNLERSLFQSAFQTVRNVKRIKRE